jgi:hypothetical protein
VATQKIADPNKSFQSVYVRVKNGINTGPVPLRTWARLAPRDKPRSQQRTGKDTGIV